MSEIGGGRAHPAIKLSCSSCNSPSCSTSQRGAVAIVSARCAIIPRQSQRLHRGGDLALGGDVEVRRALVNEQEARPPVEPAGQ
jgi:hypothetical protein